MNPASKDIILFSTADWDNPTWTNKQHMATQLAKRGFRVLYIESLGLRKPAITGRDLTRILKRLFKGIRGLKKIRENIWVYSPLVIPLHGNMLARKLNKIILHFYSKRHIRRIGFNNPILWTYNPLTIDLAGKLDESMIVYHCVDNLAASPGMPKNELAAAEKDLVHRSDIVFTTNSKLHKYISQWNPSNTHYFPNVADFDHFSAARRPGRIPDDLAAIPGPRIGFIGAISNYKIDFELISYVAEKRKNWQWVMIGQIGEGDPDTSVKLLRKPNIHFLGLKPYETLPDYLRGFDIAVLPNRINDYTNSMFPMKFFEYLSAGKPVVATDLPALHDYSDVCNIIKSPDAFIRAVDDIIDGNFPDINRCLQVAKKHTWETRLDQMERLLKSKWEQKNGA